MKRFCPPVVAPYGTPLKILMPWTSSPRILPNAVSAITEFWLDFSGPGPIADQVRRLPVRWRATKSALGKCDDSSWNGLLEYRFMLVVSVRVLLTRRLRVFGGAGFGVFFTVSSRKYPAAARIRTASVLSSSKRDDVGLKRRFVPQHQRVNGRRSHRPVLVL